MAAAQAKTVAAENEKVQRQQEKKTKRKGVRNKKWKAKKKKGKQDLKTEKRRVYPNASQTKVLKEWMDAYRWTYNQCIAHFNSMRGGKLRKGKKRTRTAIHLSEVDELEQASEKRQRLGDGSALRVPHTHTEKFCWLTRLRYHYVKADNFKTKNCWVANVEFDVRDGAVHEAIKARETNLAKGGPFHLKFKSKVRDGQQTITLLKKHWNSARGWFFEALFNTGDERQKQPKPLTAKQVERQMARFRKDKRNGKPVIHPVPTIHMRTEQNRKLPQLVAHDMKLSRTKYGDYYILFPTALDVQPEANAPTLNVDGTSGVIALDPGEVSFFTGYDAAGNVITWGRNDFERFRRLQRRIDNIESQAAIRKKTKKKKPNHKKRFLLKRKAAQIRLKIVNLREEFHRKAVKWLCENYRIILLPSYKTQQMARRVKPNGGQRAIGKKTARTMMTWAHYQFQQRLVHKAREYPWVQVVTKVNEHHTSITCSKCGRHNYNLKKKLSKCDPDYRIFRCPDAACDYVAGRDENGARNILLRFIAQNHPSAPRRAEASLEPSVQQLECGAKTTKVRRCKAKRTNTNTNTTTKSKSKSTKATRAAKKQKVSKNQGASRSALETPAWKVLQPTPTPTPTLTINSLEYVQEHLTIWNMSQFPKHLVEHVMQVQKSSPRLDAGASPV